MSNRLLRLMLAGFLIEAVGCTPTTDSTIAADVCPGVGDADGDSVCDDVDVCAAGDDNVDSDGDGKANACDACPDDASLGTFNWVVWDGPIDGDTATGVVGHTTVSYTSSSDIQTSTSLFSNTTFPSSYSVPNVDPTILNSETTTNTLTFGRPVSDPLLVFSSVGNTGTAVPVEFEDDIVVEFQSGLSDVTSNAFTGSEGYAIVRVPGVHSSITFTYTQAEWYANFVFGFGGTEVDTDTDGVADVCDPCPLDSPDDSDDDTVCDTDDRCPDEDDTVVDVDGDGICGSDDVCLAGDDGIDSDSDEAPNACDACPYVADESISEFHWVTWDTPINGTSATGSVGDVGITYVSTEELDTTSELYGADHFSDDYDIPSVDPTIRNNEITTNTLTFDRPVIDPLLVFASIGDGETYVTVDFDASIETVFTSGVSTTTSTSITGSEGYAVVRIPGQHSSVTFTYTVREVYVNFVFGFSATNDDTDDDDVPDACDTCPDDAGSLPNGCNP